MVDLDQFQTETRQWLEANCPMSLRTPTPDGELIWGGSSVNFTFNDQRLWFERMRDKNWFCPTWSTEYGGAGRHHHILLTRLDKTSFYLACVQTIDAGH